MTRFQAGRSLWIWVVAVALLAVALPRAARAAGVPVEKATWVERRDAGQKYSEAMKAYDEAKYDQALDGFRSSYDLVASPNSLLMVSRCLVKLERLDEARTTLQTTVQDAEALATNYQKYAKTAAAAHQALSDLEASSVEVRLDINGADQDAQIELMNRPVPAEHWGDSFLLPAGRVHATMTLPDGRQSEASVTGEPGAHVSLSLSAPPKPVYVAPPPAPPPPPKPQPLTTDKKPYIYATAGIGAAGIAVGTLFAVLAAIDRSDINDSCPNGQCTGSMKTAPSRQLDEAFVARMGFGLGLLGLSTAAVLWTVQGREQSSSEDVPKAQLAVGPTGVRLSSQF